MNNRSEEGNRKEAMIRLLFPFRERRRTSRETVTAAASTIKRLKAASLDRLLLAAKVTTTIVTTVMPPNDQTPKQRSTLKQRRTTTTIAKDFQDPIPVMVKPQVRWCHAIRPWYIVSNPCGFTMELVWISQYDHNGCAIGKMWCSFWFRSKQKNYEETRGLKI